MSELYPTTRPSALPRRSGGRARPPRPSPIRRATRRPPRGHRSRRLPASGGRCYALLTIPQPKESYGISQLLLYSMSSNSEIWSCVAYTFLSQSAHVCAIEHIQQRLIEKPAVYSIFVSYCLQCFCLRPNDLFRYKVASLPHVPGTEGARRKSWAPSNCRRRGTFDEKHEGSFTECSG